MKKVGIFSSFIRGSETDTSDIDILIKLEKDKESFRNYMELKFFLEDNFNRKVDLVIIENIKPLIKQSILRKAIYV